MAHAISPGCLGAAWLVPETVLSATTPASISEERKRLCMGLNLGGEGFENQQYDDEERNRQIHPVGLRNEGRVVEFEKHGAPGRHRLSDTQSEGAKIRLRHQEGRDAHTGANQFRNRHVVLARLTEVAAEPAL